MYPSYLAQGITGFLILYLVLMMIHRSNEPLEQHFHEYVIVSLVCIAIGVHGLQHAYAEVNFDFNPLTNRWHYRLRDPDQNQNQKHRLVKKLT